MENLHMPLAESSPAHSNLTIACGADDRFALPLTVTLYSALANLSEECNLDLYLVDGGFSKDSRRRLNNVVERAPSLACTSLKWLTPDLIPLRDLRVQRWLSRAAYLRLLLPDILPERIEKVLYLDSDLVIRRDLIDLWNVSLDDHTVRAVQDFGQPYAAADLGLSGLGITMHQELGIEPHSPCFNSGVMVINLKRWRQKDVSERTLGYLRKYDAYLNCHDQEGLNVVLSDEWRMLDPKWNQMSQIYALERWPETPFKKQMQRVIDEIGIEAYIVHYNGRRKPWKFNGYHPAHDLFFDTLRKVERILEA
jgi:lipopolysaccharide biosynthesis glycosyltransferase